MIRNKKTLVIVSQQQSPSFTIAATADPPENHTLFFTLLSTICIHYSQHISAMEELSEKTRQTGININKSEPMLDFVFI